MTSSVHARPVGRRRAHAFTAPLVLVLGAWNNVVVTRLPRYPGSYVPANVAATGLLLMAARTAGISREELGLDRQGGRAACGGADRASP
jgi:hypothetical protein